MFEFDPIAPERGRKYDTDFQEYCYLRFSYSCILVFSCSRILMLLYSRHVFSPCILVFSPHILTRVKLAMLATIKKTCYCCGQKTNRLYLYASYSYYQYGTLCILCYSLSASVRHIKNTSWSMHKHSLSWNLPPIHVPLDSRQYVNMYAVPHLKCSMTNPSLFDSCGNFSSVCAAMFWKFCQHTPCWWRSAMWAHRFTTCYIMT